MITPRTVTILALAAFASAAGVRAGDPLIALIAHQYQVSAGQAAAALTTSFLVSYGFLQIAWGPLGDRMGRIRLAWIASAISAIGALACALAPSLPALGVARFISGATVGALVPLAMAWIGDVVPYERRQATIARFLIGNILGASLGAAAAGVLGEHVGWRSVFVLLGILYVAIALLLALELRRNPLARRPKGTPPSVGAAFRAMTRLLARPWVRVILATVFIEGALFSGPLAFAAYDLHHRHGVSTSASGALVAAFGFGGLLYAAFANRVVPRLGERGLALAGGIALGAAYLGMFLAPAAGWAVPALLAAGAGFYMLHNTLQVNATQMAPEARGGAVALFAFSLFTGQSAGVWVCAQAIDRWGARPVYAVCAVGLFVLALVFRSRLRRREFAKG
jgi:predicted MFS family arabinose efflux permease